MRANIAWTENSIAVRDGDNNNHIVFYQSHIAVNNLRIGLSR